MFFKKLFWWLNSKESTCNAGDKGLILGSGRSPGGGNGNPLQYSCLENPTDREAWRATVRRVAKSRTQWLKRLCTRARTHTHTHTHMFIYEEWDQGGTWAVPAHRESSARSGLQVDGSSRGCSEPLHSLLHPWEAVLLCRVGSCSSEQDTCGVAGSSRKQRLLWH